MREAAASIFPDIPISREADFAPMCDLSSGDFSSSVAIEVARSIKRDANGIAHEILNRMPSALVGQARSDAGYIVCSGLPRDIVVDEVPVDVRAALGVDADHPRSICCLLPDITEPLYARLRLLARVSLQGLLGVMYQGRCTLRLEPEPAVEVASVGEVIKLFRSAVERALRSEGEIRLSISSIPEGTRENPVFVWTSHHYHDRLLQSDRKALGEARRHGTIALRMPEDAWLLSRDRVRSDLLERRSLERVITQLGSDAAWMRFLFHASSSVLSGDFDPAVALFDEFASPLYSFSVLVSRYQRFNQSFPLPVTRGQLVSALPEIGSDRSLILRSLCMPIYTARAVRRGELDEWCVAFEDLVRQGHRFINAPQTRFSLQHGSLSAGVSEIVAGLGFGLSSILGFVTEGDACADR
jgi:hypothetical protein